RARGRVQPIARDATALFVGKVENIQGGVKTKVARAQQRLRLHSGRRVGGQTAGVFVELELKDGVGAVARDVGHKGVAIGRVGLHSLGPGRRGQPLDGWAPYRSIFPNRMDRYMSTLVIGP